MLHAAADWGVLLSGSSCCCNCPSHLDHQGPQNTGTHINTHTLTDVKHSLIHFYSFWWWAFWSPQCQCSTKFGSSHQIINNMTHACCCCFFFFLQTSLKSSKKKKRTSLKCNKSSKKGAEVRKRHTADRFIVLFKTKQHCWWLCALGHQRFYFNNLNVKNSAVVSHCLKQLLYI